MLNSHSDARLTKGGGMAFDVWVYILGLEMKAHADPMGAIDPVDWQEYYENDYTPHDAVEEDFDHGRD